MLAFITLFAVAADPLACQESVVDRGEVRIGPRLVQPYVLTNVGHHVLVVSDIRSTCGCLSPTIDRRELTTGQSARLNLEVNTLSQPAGSHTWVTTVTYRVDGEVKSLPLELKAELVSEIQVEPASLAFQIRQARSAMVSVTDTRTKPFKITGVGTSVPHLIAELLPQVDMRRQQIRITAQPDGLPGVQSAVAWFTTNDPLYPQVHIPVTLNFAAKQRVVASPSVVLLDGGSAVVQLRDSEGQPVVIQRCEVEGPLNVNSATGPGNAATMRVTLNRRQWDGSPTVGRVFVHLVSPPNEVVAVKIDVR